MGSRGLRWLSIHPVAVWIIFKKKPLIPIQAKTCGLEKSDPSDGPLIQPSEVGEGNMSKMGEEREELMFDVYCHSRGILRMEPECMLEDWNSRVRHVCISIHSVQRDPKNTKDSIDRHPEMGDIISPAKSVTHRGRRGYPATLRTCH